MTRTAVDAGVIVAALTGWHADHARALGALARVADTGTLVVPATALVEAFCVLTRLPRGHRIAPADARHLLERAFHDRADIAPLGEAATWELSELAAAAGHAGGSVHDLAVLLAARDAGSDALLTLDPLAFRRFGAARPEIVTP